MLLIRFWWNFRDRDLSLVPSLFSAAPVLNILQCAHLGWKDLHVLCYLSHKWRLWGSNTWSSWHVIVKQVFESWEKRWNVTLVPVHVNLFLYLSLMSHPRKRFTSFSSLPSVHRGGRHTAKNAALLRKLWAKIKRTTSFISSIVSVSIWFCFPWAGCVQPHIITDIYVTRLSLHLLTGCLLVKTFKTSTWWLDSSSCLKVKLLVIYQTPHAQPPQLRLKRAGHVCGDVTCLVFICVCVFGASSTVGTLLDQCIPAGWTHTHCQISALCRDIRASPSRKQQVHHSGAPTASSTSCPEHNFSWLRHSLLINVSFILADEHSSHLAFPQERVGSLHAGGCENQHIFH